MPQTRTSQSSLLTGSVGRGVRQAFRRLYPSDYATDDDLLAARIEPRLTPSAVVLDAGCGSGAMFRHSWKQSTKFFVGCDIGDGITTNASLDAGVQATLGDLPFADESFDIIFSRYVLEHVADPERVFREFARVLRPGGRLLILTPNRNHYVTLVSRLTPHWFHEAIGRVRGIGGDDVFPTLYRANSRRALMRLAHNAGLTSVEYLSRENFPLYLLWSLPSFLIGVGYERLVNRFTWLSGMRVTILATYERPR